VGEGGEPLDAGAHACVISPQARTDVRVEGDRAAITRLDEHGVQRVEIPGRQDG